MCGPEQPIVLPLVGHHDLANVADGSAPFQRVQPPHRVLRHPVHQADLEIAPDRRMDLLHVERQAGTGHDEGQGPAENGDRTCGADDRQRRAERGNADVTGGEMAWHEPHGPQTDEEEHQPDGRHA